MDERTYLENELKNYRYIVDKVYYYNEIIARSEAAKEGLTSPHMKEVIYENAGDPYHDNKIDLDEEIKEAVKKRRPWVDRKLWLDVRLAILDPVEYKVIKYRYMMTTQATFEWIADVVPCHVNWVKPTIEKILDKMLKECGNPQ